MDPRSMTNVLIGASRIKYSILQEIFDPIKIEPKQTVNFIIDGYAMLYRLYRANYNFDVDHVDDDVFIQEFVSACINTVAHYRRFIATRMRRSNRIFIIFNRKVPDYQTNLIPSWGREYYDRFCDDDSEYGQMNKVMTKAIDFLKELCQYFTDVFYLNTDGIEDHTVMYWLLHEYPNDYHIIFSRNELMLQFCSDHCCILYPKRDDSIVIGEKDVGKFYFRQAKYNAKSVDADNIRHILTIGGIKSRGIPAPGIKGTVRIAKGIDKLIDKDMYIPNLNISRFIGLINTVIRNPYTESQSELMREIFKCVDGKLSYEALRRAQIRKIAQSRINLYDADGLQKLNESLTDVEDVINITDLNMSSINNVPADIAVQRFLDSELNVRWMEDL